MSIRLEKQNWTYEEYCQLPDDGNRYEVIDGRLYMSASPRTLHQTLSRRIQDLLYDLEKAGRGWVFDAPTDLIMPGCTPVVPDLLFLDASQGGLIQEKFIEGVPTLLVEILSPSNPGHDRVTKLNRYARSRVPYYWIVDGAHQTFEVLELAGDNYRILHALSLGDAFEFRGIRFEMDAIFAPMVGQTPEQ
jgi:Uma2 family endonuclease